MGIGSHTKPNNGLTNEWYTPPEIIKALGYFDLDPCAGIDMPWRTARMVYTVEEDGLAQPWDLGSRVWLNPPYGQHTTRWLEKLAAHGRGTAIVFARTETRMFFQHVWPKASAIHFFEGRLFFYRPNGIQASANAGGPSVLVAYGAYDAEMLRKSGLPGKFIDLDAR